MQARRGGAAACAVLGIGGHPRPKRSELRLLGAGLGAQILGLAGASKVPMLRAVGCVLFLLLWVPPQVWGSSEGEWNQGARIGALKDGERERGRDLGKGPPNAVE